MRFWPVVRSYTATNGSSVPSPERAVLTQATYRPSGEVLAWSPFGSNSRGVVRPGSTWSTPQPTLTSHGPLTGSAAGPRPVVDVAASPVAAASPVNAAVRSRARRFIAVIRQPP